MRAALLTAALLVIRSGWATGQAPFRVPPQAAGEASALSPDTVFRVPEGPSVVLLRADGSPLVSLRLVIPLTEGAVEAGSASVLRRIRLEALRSLAQQTGALVDASRTRRGLEYAVSGALADYDYLAWLVRQAVADPRPDRADVEHAVQAVRAEAAQTAETAEGHLRERLRQEIWPSQAPMAGTAASLGRINPASLRDFWARTHQASRMSLVVVGDVDPVMLLAAFQSIGAPEERAGGPLSAPVPRNEGARDLQILRTWHGLAFVVRDGSDPRPAIAAALLADELRSDLSGMEGGVELWEAGGVSALIVVAAAYREDVQRMRSAMPRLPGAAAEKLDLATLERTIARARSDLLFGARTPWGLASLVAHFADGTGDPNGAAQFLSSLEALDLETVRAFLTKLQGTAPIRVELRP